MSKEKELSKERLLDIYESLNDFVIAYLFTIKPRLHNAERILTALQSQKNANGLLNEILVQYTRSAVTEVSLTLYDSIEVLRQISDFEYPANSNIDHLMRFRRHIIAHRAKNWGSPEHTATRKQVSVENPAWIIKTAFEAVKDFVKELKNRKIPLDHGNKWQATPTINTPEISLLFNSVPITPIFVAVPSQDELVEFFGEGALKT